MRKDVTKKKVLEKAKETQRRMTRIEDNDEDQDEEVDVETLMEGHGERGKRRRKQLGIMVHE